VVARLIAARGGAIPFAVPAAVLTRPALARGMAAART
jgi:hypothetical protein